MRSTSFNGTRAWAKLVHLDTIKGGGGKKPTNILVLEEYCLFENLGFCTPRCALKNGTRLSDITGPENAEEFQVVFGVIFVQVGSLCLTRFSAMIFQRKPNTGQNRFFLVRSLRSKNDKNASLQMGETTGFIYIYIYMYLFICWLWSYYLGQVCPAHRLLSGPSFFTVCQKAL